MTLKPEDIGDSPHGPSALRRVDSWAVFVAGLVALKLSFLLFDHDPRLFLGDSRSYIWTALSGWIPNDRSFVYGFLLRILALGPHSLYPIIIVQTAFGLIGAVLVALVLHWHLGAPRRIAFVGGMLFAADPYQLMYERFLMTEAAATFVLAFFLFVAVSYVRDSNPWKLVLVNALGVTLVSLRASFVGTTYLTAVVLPFVNVQWPTPKPLAGLVARAYSSMRQAAWGRTLTHVTVSILTLVSFHVGYKALNGRLSRQPPAYIYADGLFLLGSWSPILMSEDGIDVSTSRVLSEPGRYNIRDYQLRNNQIFSKGGLVDRLASLYPDRYELNRVGKRIAESALCRDPLGVAKIALFGYARYWSQREMVKIMSTDRGEDRPIDADLIDWLDRKFGTSSDLFEQRGLGKWQGSSLTTWYQAVAGWPWALVLLHTPILLFVSVVRDRGSGRRIAVFLCLVATVIAATPCVLAPVSSPRYLHPISWILPISLCLLCTRRSTQRGDQPSRTVAFPSRKRVHRLSG